MTVLGLQLMLLLYSQLLASITLVAATSPGNRVGEVNSDFVRVYDRLEGFEEPFYSVINDIRSSNWSVAVPSYVSSNQLQRLLPVRQSLLEIVVCVDLSNPVDLDILEALLYTPKPMDMHILPVVVSGSRANAILTKCYSSVAFGESGKLDSGRVGDFIKALADLASIRTQGFGFPVKPRGAMLACRLFTQDLPDVNTWVEDEDLEVPMSEMQEQWGLVPNTVIINGWKFEKVTLDNLGSILVNAQFAALSLEGSGKRIEL